MALEGRNRGGTQGRQAGERHGLWHGRARLNTGRDVPRRAADDESGVEHARARWETSVHRAPPRRRTKSLHSRARVLPTLDPAPHQAPILVLRLCDPCPRIW